MQFVVPMIILVAAFGSLGGDPQVSASGQLFYLQNAGFIWVPLFCYFQHWHGLA